MHILYLLSGLILGVLSGFLGVGGGFALVPLLLALGKPPILAVGTSALVVFIFSLSGSFHNWKRGHIDWRLLGPMALSCVALTQLGVVGAEMLSDFILLLSFASFLLLSIILMFFKNKAAKIDQAEQQNPRLLLLIMVGGIGGFFAGLFGVGGGVVLVPLQTHLLKMNMKQSIRNSLGIVMLGSLASFASHALLGNVLVLEGILLGAGGIFGTQIGVRLLPTVNEKTIKRIFLSILSLLTVYIFYKAFMY